MAALGLLISTAGEQSHAGQSAFGWGEAHRVPLRCARGRAAGLSRWDVFINNGVSLTVC